MSLKSDIQALIKQANEQTDTLGEQDNRFKQASERKRLSWVLTGGASKESILEKLQEAVDSNDYYDWIVGDVSLDGTSKTQVTHFKREDGARAQSMYQGLVTGALGKRERKSFGKAKGVYKGKRLVRVLFIVSPEEQTE